MNVKRFTARTSRDALSLVRQALGDDAVVLSTKPSRRRRRGPGDGARRHAPGRAHVGRGAERRRRPAPAADADAERLPQRAVGTTGRDRAAARRTRRSRTTSSGSR